MSERGKGWLLVALLGELVPVCETTGHQADEDVVKWLCPGPFLFRIVNFECAIRRDTRIVSAARSSQGDTYKAG